MKHISYMLPFFILCVALPQLVFAAPDVPDDPTALRALISEKQTELLELQKQREELEQKLAATGEEKLSLKKELQNINYRVNQLELSVERNTLLIEKLGYEISSLEMDIKRAGEDIRNAKGSVALLLAELQRADHDTPLTILLKHASLSKSASVMQSIATVTNRLTLEAQSLATLQATLVKNQSEVTGKKQEKQAEQRTLLNQQSLVEETKNEKEYLLKETENKEKVYETHIAELEKAQSEISDVMTAIEDRLRATIDASLLPTPRPGVFAFAVKDSCITQEYGRTDFAAQAYKTKFHGGLDFRAREGEPIYAALDGTVAVVDNNDRGVARWNKYQYGKYVIIEHDNNLSTLYAHLSRQAVGEGQEVKTGDLVGYAGNTGYSFGAHLHFGVYLTPVRGWQERNGDNNAREHGGLIAIPPAAGLVPVGATLDPAQYLYPSPSCPS
ncbi:hypothetical protein A2110_00700 [Candidatus Jorgensenbacteria bacterium GWA1_54_12]|uniref:M23ase beta-sheet core domain-containing protein n=1 Tax=Candidatus Jorgensenbacteria bacterium GWA1_54_12 TaxID=1798468 RepID=A0A1F6BLK5_9BACT|nr:MAG: hypothetical protein A2110_00700 [Candidatus Jorgensenbacteria bacterium GWA1_54_12]